jgi:hypothetical protein
MDLPLRRCSFQSRISARIALPALSVTARLKLLTYVPHRFCDRRGRNVYPRTLKPHTPSLKARHVPWRRCFGTVREGVSHEGP